MRNLVIFVDAGYLFSAGSELLAGRVQPRERLTLDRPDSLLATLKDHSQALWDGEPLRLLRTYWYDGAREGLPSASQIAIGDLPRVKLRLGRVSGGGQKGVDGLIILDLITLARNRAADVVLLLSGDEDLRETVLHAQSYGVTVVVAGFPPTAQQRQSVLLLREADHTIYLNASDLSDTLLVKDEGTRASANEAGTSPDAAISMPPPEETNQLLDKICRSVVTDPRFQAGPISETRGGQVRLISRADRVLVARLAEATGIFPVDPDLLGRARERCVAISQEGPEVPGG